MSYDPFAHVALPANEPPKDGNGRLLAIVVSVVVIAAVAVLAVAGTRWLLNRDGDEPAAAASPSPTAEPVDSPNPAPTAEAAPFEVDEDALARAEALGFSPVAYEMDIEEISDHYRELSSSGELYKELIPRTEEGADYVYAFMLVVTDYRAAGLFGGAFEGESRDEFADIELQFLTVSDMDVDIRITQSDGTVFEHDGTPPAPVD